MPQPEPKNTAEQLDQKWNDRHKSMQFLVRLSFALIALMTLTVILSAVMDK